jgi:thiosulfate/3-mercaptopyruvate sulfurtransferase
VRSGNIPGSKNVPYNKVLNEDFTFKSKTDIVEQFQQAKIDTSKEIIGTCGSGVTASVLQLAIDHAGLGSGLRRIYDGAWSEYGSIPPKTKHEVGAVIEEVLKKKKIV